MRVRFTLLSVLLHILYFSLMQEAPLSTKTLVWDGVDPTQHPRPSTHLRRSLGGESFPNVLLFRAYTPLPGKISALMIPDAAERTGG